MSLDVPTWGKQSCLQAGFLAGFRRQFPHGAEAGMNAGLQAGLLAPRRGSTHFPRRTQMAGRDQEFRDSSRPTSVLGTPFHSKPLVLGHKDLKLYESLTTTTFQTLAAILAGVGDIPDAIAPKRVKSMIVGPLGLTELTAETSA